MSFAPVYSENSRALILGTWPSPKSREMAFYYGHPQNRFWPLLAALTGFELTRGVLCAFQRPKPRTVEELCRNARRVAVLENVMNPTNIGAIFRSAAALGVDAVLLDTAHGPAIVPKGGEDDVPLDR